MNTKLVIKALGESRIKAKELLANHTYFKIGGPADLFFEATSSVDLTKAVQVCLQHEMPFFVLGGGSNILVGDKGFRGLVIKNRADSVKTTSFQGKITRQKASINTALVEAESGALLNKLVRYSIEEGLGGIEVFLSVPGTVGGALYNNSHYRPEKDEFIGNRLNTATLITSNGDVNEVNKSYFKFGYDRSILHQTHETIVKATFSLTGGDKDKLWQTATDMVRRRNQRQPIGIACSGCTFRNISVADALRIGTPEHTQSAGYIIDHSGLKGAQVGGAQVSNIHASFIENTGGATARDVLNLIDKIKTTVYVKFGVKLELEIFLVGEF